MKSTASELDPRTISQPTFQPFLPLIFEMVTVWGASTQLINWRPLISTGDQFACWYPYELRPIPVPRTALRTVAVFDASYIAVLAILDYIYWNAKNTLQRKRFGCAGSILNLLSSKSYCNRAGRFQASFNPTPPPPFFVPAVLRFHGKNLAFTRISNPLLASWSPRDDIDVGFYERRFDI